MVFGDTILHGLKLNQLITRGGWGARPTLRLFMGVPYLCSHLMKENASDAVLQPCRMQLDHHLVLMFETNMDWEHDNCWNNTSCTVPAKYYCIIPLKKKDTHRQSGCVWYMRMFVGEFRIPQIWSILCMAKSWFIHNTSPNSSIHRLFICGFWQADLKDGAVDHSIQDAFAVGVLQGFHDGKVPW